MAFFAGEFVVLRTRVRINLALPTERVKIGVVARCCLARLHNLAGIAEMIGEIVEDVT
jgi:hypothetical protein